MPSIPLCSPISSPCDFLERSRPVQTCSRTLLNFLERFGDSELPIWNWSTLHKSLKVFMRPGRLIFKFAISKKQPTHSTLLDDSSVPEPSLCASPINRSLSREIIKTENFERPKSFWQKQRPVRPKPQFGHKNLRFLPLQPRRTDSFEMQFRPKSPSEIATEKGDCVCGVLAKAHCSAAFEAFPVEPSAWVFLTGKLPRTSVQWNVGQS